MPQNLIPQERSSKRISNFIILVRVFDFRTFITKSDLIADARVEPRDIRVIEIPSDDLASILGTLPF